MENLDQNIKPVRLHLELKREHLPAKAKVMLKRYGDSSTGDKITRDILIPSDMPLHNLHYTIQVLFGWRNSHLRSFNLPKENFDKLTNKTIKGWANLVGDFFVPPSIGEDYYWNDNYEGGSEKLWFKKRYTGPYKYEGYFKDVSLAKLDVENLLSEYKNLPVREPFADYVKRAKVDENAKINIIKHAPLIDLTIQEVDDSIYFGFGFNDLMENIIVDQLIAYKDEEIFFDGKMPSCHHLDYNYDFGDNWEVKITKHKSCDDLIAANLITTEELEAAKAIVTNQHKPVCLSMDGISLIDDVGNLFGFAEFLEEIYEGSDKVEVASMKRWGKSQGYSEKKLQPQKIL